MNEEQFYDEEIAPALLAIANRCNERGIPFVASVEYKTGEHATTFQLGPDACLAMQMVYMCSRTAPNVDSYLINLIRHAKQNGISMEESMFLNKYADKEKPSIEG